MIDEIFEVSREEYSGFVEQIKKEARDIKVESPDSSDIIETRIYSKNTQKLLCARVSNEITQEEKYYVVEMPEDYERKAPIPKRILELKTKEEVQKFFDYLSKLQKQEEQKNDGTLS